ncbi:uncharacterized protein TRAVEDRAFT_71787 [Trametes versicolor FP-101664 SS1]|uniref:uncharacterized protein n=1 Tax=Trametes versicolor (strain FP-101664) TaxID=717944 RepID=UPI00046229A9|nr:uncharacterized protein TRAVEDRAFT_71787 [Trametes versicolor FP-101664 SS1]EIW59896.1 hypothetical protein TRAVEDRAFT_71787 [Trametes versicolor FP-101664 SS1]
MPPRKKQRVDGDQGVVASRRTTRSSAKAAQGRAVAEDPPVKKKAKCKTAEPDALNDAIYNYLDLEDIFNLSLTCKKFRAFFMDKALEKRVWVPARANTPGLPDRPPWIGECAFAYLLYSPHCHNCGRANLQNIVYGWFIRLCSACLQERTVWYRIAATEAETIAKGSGLCKIFDVIALPSYFRAHQHSDSPDSDEKFNRLFRDDVDRVFAQFKALPASTAQDEFFDQVKAEHKARIPYAEAVHVWMRKRASERRVRRANARRARFNIILDRLREAGWGKEVDYLGKEGLDIMRRMPVLRQSSKLTDGAWQKVFAVLDKFLETTRENRINHEYRENLRARFEALEEAIATHYVTFPRTPPMDYRPQYIDFAFTSQCRAIADLPASETVTADHFAAIVPALAQKWDEDRKRQLTEYILPHLGDIAADVDPLELAIACFTIGGPNILSCFGHIRTMRYPAILKHHCFTGKDCFRTTIATAAEYFEDDLYTRSVKTMDSGREWEARMRERSPTALSVVRVPFHIRGLARAKGARDVVNRMRRIVAAVGLDPARATIRDLERCGVWLRCVVCETHKPDDVVYAWSWSGAYGHDQWHTTATMSKVEMRGVPEWRRADDADMVKVRAYKDAELPETSLCDYGWSCALCPAFDASVEDMTEHLFKTHDISGFAQARRDGAVYPLSYADNTSRLADAVSLGARIELKTA